MACPVRSAGRLALLGAPMLVALVLCAAIVPTPAVAAPAPPGVQAAKSHSAATPTTHPHVHDRPPCTVEVPLVGVELPEPLCEAERATGEAASAAGNGVLDLLARWMIDAATQITGFVAREMARSTTPQLESSWFAAQFAPMADLGAGLGLLVTLIAFASAAVRRSPEALAGTLAGIARAGVGTGLLVALTTIGLRVTDEISSAVLTGSPHSFWTTVAQAWGKGGVGGFGSSALAMLIALVEVFAGLFVWLELIVRDAAIYVAVLFFPAVLAAAIWPALRTWPGRLGRLLLLFVVLKPVALIVLSLAGNAAAAGLSGAASGGLPGSVGTILAAVVILALAAFAPWALMYLLAADAESAYAHAGMRTATASAVSGNGGRSLRNAGGLRGLAPSPGSGPAAPSGGTSPKGGGGAPAGAPSPGGGQGPGGAAPGAGGSETPAATSGEAAPALAPATVPAGSVAVAAGMSEPRSLGAQPSRSASSGERRLRLVHDATREAPSSASSSGRPHPGGSAA